MGNLLIYEKANGGWLFFPHFCGSHIFWQHKILSETATMFEQLQKKWKVNGFQLTLILCTFAIGGSATGFAGKK